MIAIDMRVYYNKLAKQYLPGHPYLFRSPVSVRKNTELFKFQV